MQVPNAKTETKTRTKPGPGLGVGSGWAYLGLRLWLGGSREGVDRPQRGVERRQAESRRVERRWIEQVGGGGGGWQCR